MQMLRGVQNKPGVWGLKRLLERRCCGKWNKLKVHEGIGVSKIYQRRKALKNCVIFDGKSDKYKRKDNNLYATMSDYSQSLVNSKVIKTEFATITTSADKHTFEGCTTGYTIKKAATGFVFSCWANPKAVEDGHVNGLKLLIPYGTHGLDKSIEFSSNFAINCTYAVKIATFALGSYDEEWKESSDKVRVLRHSTNKYTHISDNRRTGMVKTALEIVKEGIEEGKTFGQVFDEMKQAGASSEEEAEYAGEVWWSDFADQHESCYNTISAAVAALFQSDAVNNFEADAVISGTEDVTAGKNENGKYTVIWGIGSGVGGWTTLADALVINDWWLDFNHGSV
jgi:hypothetical protein